MPAVVYGVHEGQKFVGETSFRVVTCYSCGIPYGIPEQLYQSALKYKGDKPGGWSLCCPMGHTWHYCGETEIEKQTRLRQSAERRATAERDLREDTERRLRSQKSATTRARNQRDRERRMVSNGVCPCCRRTFKQLARHMKSQHPEYGPIGEHS